MQYYDPKTLAFLLSEVHHLEELLSAPRYAAYDKQSIDLLLDAVKDFSDTSLFPYIKEMDEQPAVFKDGRVKVHEQFGPIMEKQVRWDSLVLRWMKRTTVCSFPC